MDSAIYELGRNQYRQATGYADMARDKDGFVILRPTASRVDERKAELTTNIDDLEAKLKQIRAEQSQTAGNPPKDKTKSKTRNAGPQHQNPGKSKGKQRKHKSKTHKER